MDSRCFWLPALAFAALAALFELTDLDLRGSDAFFDFAAQRWTYGDSGWADAVIHRGGRALIAVLGVAVLAGWCISFRSARLRPWRRALLYLLLTLVLSNGLASLARSTSKRYCPWDLQRYGGTAPHLGLLDPLPHGLQKGRCFPSVHASGAFALFGLYFVLRQRRPSRAWVGIALGGGLGAIFTFGQVARGAHLASHGVWTAAICWFVAFGLYALAFRQRLTD